VSYAAGLAVVAAAPAGAARAIGVDAEAGPDRPMPALAGLFAPRHPPTLREWTRIEAALKADGRGLRVEPRDVRLDGATAVVPSSATVELFDVDGPAGLVVSFAIDRRDRSAP
jgi:4'-phosphopantetheinyl transferase